MKDIFIKYFLEKDELPIHGIGLLKKITEPANFKDNIITPKNQYIRLLLDQTQPDPELINYIAIEMATTKENASLFYNSFINETFIKNNIPNIDFLGFGSIFKNSNNIWEFKQEIHADLIHEPIQLIVHNTNKIYHNTNNTTWVYAAIIISIIAIILIIVKFYFL